MAKGSKSGGRPFAKGNKANPAGGGAITPATRAIRKITLTHIEEVADVILDGNLDKLKALANNPDTSVLKVWIAKAAATGIQKGDLASLTTLLDRIMGKPKERHVLEHSGNIGIAQKFANMTDEELERLAIGSDNVETPKLNK